MRNYLFVPFALSLILALPACAQSKLSTDQKQHLADAMQRRFTAADRDGDGMLTRDEAKAMPRISSHFDEIDTNHDDKVTPTEILAYFAAQRGRE
ncbi:hypothetical protein [Dyella japonica]|uniref:Ca2+-binding EF-hand superfamily protein n=1 Tax=Dyella japonica TaxID=231455 RepID=A0ABV2JP15_9GAMM